MLNQENVQFCFFNFHDHQGENAENKGENAEPRELIFCDLSITEEEAQSDEDEHSTKAESEDDEQSTKSQSEDDDQITKSHLEEDERLEKARIMEEDERAAKAQMEEDERLAKAQMEDDERAAKAQLEEDERIASTLVEDDEKISTFQAEEDEQLARALQESLNIEAPPPRYDSGNIFNPYPFFYPSGYRYVQSTCIFFSLIKGLVAQRLAYAQPWQAMISLIASCKYQ